MKKKKSRKSKFDIKKRLKKEKLLIYGILFCGALVLIYWNLFSWLVISWTTNPYINYGIMIPFISGYFIYSKRKLAKTDVNPYGLFIILVSMILYLFSSLYIKALSLLLLISGLVFYFFGTKVLRKIKFEILYLIFMIPLPELSIEIIGFWLKEISLSLSFRILSPFMQLGIRDDYITLAGDSILRYGLPCSGMESFMAFLAFSVLFAYLYERKWWRAGILIGFSPIAAILLNSLRLSIMILVATLSTDLILSVFHLMSGPMLVVLYGIILILIYRRSVWTN